MRAPPEKRNPGPGGTGRGVELVAQDQVPSIYAPGTDDASTFVQLGDVIEMILERIGRERGYSPPPRYRGMAA